MSFPTSPETAGTPALLEDPGEAADIARLEGQKMCAGRIHPRRTVLVGEPQHGLGLAQVA